MCAGGHSEEPPAHTLSCPPQAAHLAVRAPRSEETHCSWTGGLALPLGGGDGTKEARGGLSVFWAPQWLSRGRVRPGSSQCICVFCTIRINYFKE